MAHLVSQRRQKLGVVQAIPEVFRNEYDVMIFASDEAPCNSGVGLLRPRFALFVQRRSYHDHVRRIYIKSFSDRMELRCKFDLSVVKENFASLPAFLNLDKRIQLFDQTVAVNWRCRTQRSGTDNSAAADSDEERSPHIRYVKRA